MAGQDSITAYFEHHHQGSFQGLLRLGGEVWLGGGRPHSTIRRGVERAGSKGLLRRGPNALVVDADGPQRLGVDLEIANTFAAREEVAK